MVTVSAIPGGASGVDRAKRASDTGGRQGDRHGGWHGDRHGGWHRLAPQADERQPMIELNTTPLIDVMLVLLVMLIITIPSQSHQVAIDLPGKAVEHREINPLRNRLTIDAGGAARWNGAVIGDRALAATLRDVAAMDRPAEVHFEPAAAARYERVDAVLALASQAGVATLGFVGNDRYRDSF